MHIYDAARFPLAPVDRAAPTSAAVAQYRLLQKRLGTTRVIAVTPRNYATDNRATVDAIAQMAPNARGVAVVHPTVSDAELKKLHAAGIRGIRFSLGDPKTAAVTADMIEPLAKRVAGLGWHVQINWTSDDIAAADALWKRLPTPIVFDHIGQLPASGGVAHPAYAVMRRLLDAGRAWVKLSVTYTNSRVGPPGYADVVEVGQALVTAVPERLVWGSNWPHPNEPKSPDDARLFDSDGAMGARRGGSAANPCPEPGPALRFRRGVTIERFPDVRSVRPSGGPRESPAEAGHYALH